MKIYKTWTELKDLVSSKNLLLQYHESEYRYLIFATEEEVEYFTELWKDTSQVTGLDTVQNDLDVTDFEDTYKSEANQSPITAEGITKVSVVSGDINVEVDNVGLKDSADNRINPAKEDGNLEEIKQTIGQESGSTVLTKLQDIWDKLNSMEFSGTVSLDRYRLKVYNSKTPITIASGDTELANIDFDGQLDGIVVNFTRSDVDFVLNIDGMEICRVNLSDLKNNSTYNLTSNTDFEFPITVSNDGKQITMQNLPPSDVTTNVTVEASLSGSDVDMTSILIIYREKIT